MVTKVIGISRSEQPRNVFLAYKWDQENLSNKKEGNLIFSN